MASLFVIDTPRVHLTWSRRADQPVPVPPGAAADPAFGLRVEPLDEGAEPTIQTNAAAGTHLFEETDYVLFVQSRSEEPVQVRHRDPVLLSGLHASHDGRVQHGTVNVGSQVGRSRFVVEVGGRPHLAFEVEVLPSKLEYRADYVALRDDVQAIARSLVLAYLRATRQAGRSDAGDAADDLAWALLLRATLDDLEAALHHLSRYPQWGTARQVEPVRTERIRRPDAAVRRAIQRRGRPAVGTNPEAWSLPARLPAAQAVYTLDTPEHRWLATRVHRLRRRLAVLTEVERDRPGRRTEAVQHELTAMAARLDRLARLDALQAASPEGRLAVPSLRLLAAPGYREAYQACLRLQRGLGLYGDVLAASLKDLHVLYEYWCFLALVRAAAEVTGVDLPWNDVLAVEQDGLRFRLRKGRQQTVTLPTYGGGRWTVTYNPRFGGPGYLVPQQPDFMLTVAAPGQPVRRYILDAKYRLDAALAYVERYGMPGPPIDALNTLHRYRDAIVDADLRRTVVQAVALFPYREVEAGTYAASRHARALAEVGVGAIPLLPGATQHLTAWLEGLVDWERDRT